MKIKLLGNFSWRHIGKVSLFFVIVLMIRPGLGWATTTLDIYDGPVSIDENGDYILFGNGPGNSILVNTGIHASVVLSNLVGSTFIITNNARVDFILLGSNRLSGISLSSNAEMAVTENSIGSLYSHGGTKAGIKGGKISVCRGFVQADSYGYNYEPGIGGEVNIMGGTVNASGAWYGAGIEGNVNISGDAIVNAYGGGSGGAGIGGSRLRNGGTTDIGGLATVTARGSIFGAGIGGGASGSGGVITICSGASVNASGGSYMPGPSNSIGGAGIGGGIYRSGGIISISSGATVRAVGAGGGEGIGGGYSGGGGTISISGESIVAQSTTKALGGTPYIDQACTIIAGSSANDAQVMSEYGSEKYVYIVLRKLNNIALDNDNFNLHIDSVNGYSNVIVERSDCVVATGGAWNWESVSNYSITSDGTVTVPMNEKMRQLLRVKLAK